MRSAFIILVVAHLVQGCAVPPDLEPCSDDIKHGRYAQIQTFVQRDNAIWLNGPADLIRSKMCKMAGAIPACVAFQNRTGFSDIPDADDPYNFMRGTVGLFYADIARRSAMPRLPTKMLSNSDATRVLMVVDPHPENLGTAFRRLVDLSGPLLVDDFTLEWFDFDSSTYGPYTLDIRRAALGLTTFSASVDTCGHLCQRDISSAMVRTYIDTVRSISLGRSPRFPERGSLVEDLIKKAIKDGQKQEKLGECTRQTEDDQRRLVLESDACDGLTAPTSIERRDIQLLADQYRSHRPEANLVLLDSAKRIGQGVSSLPAPRYILLWRITDPFGKSRDFMVNVRLVIEPSQLPIAQERIQAVFASNEERMRIASQRLWSTQYVDPNFEMLTLGNRTFKALSWSSFYKDFGHDKLPKAFKKGAVLYDLVLLGRWVGYSLAVAHVRGGLQSGKNGIATLVADIAGRESQLIREIEHSQRVDYQRLLSDHRTFQCILERDGLLAGLERAWMDVSP